MTTEHGLIPININQIAQEDMVSGVDFILNPVPELSADSVKPNAPVERNSDIPEKKSSSDQVAPVGKKEAFVPAEPKSSGGIIQVAALTGEKNGVKMKNKLKMRTGHTAMVIHEDRYYKMRLSGFADSEQALGYLPKLKEHGYSWAFVAGI